MTVASLLKDAITTLNAVRGDDPGLWGTDSNAAYTRLVETLGQDCHGKIYTPEEIGLKVDCCQASTEYEKLCNLIMEVIPKRIVKETRDIEELVMAAGAVIVGYDAIAAARKNLESQDDRPTSDDEAISAAHPLSTGDHDRYLRALEMVGARHSKYALVDLVNWLLYRIEEKK